MKLLINNNEWEVIEVEPLDARLIVHDNYCFGTCNYAQYTIYIDKHLNQLNKLSTLRHELTHAYIHSFLIERKENYTEEDLCQFVSHYAISIIDDAKIILQGLHNDDEKEN